MNYTLYTPTISIKDGSSYDEPYKEQLECAHQLFDCLYRDGNPIAHVVAEMQSGKTGVITTLLRLLRSNPSLQIEHMFVLTGMSDCEWIHQTKERLPYDLRNNVFHNNTLHVIERWICNMFTKTGTIRNIILLIDESHIASNSFNRIGELYSKMITYCPVDEWVTHNIKIVSVSATDPASIISSIRNGIKIIRLATNETYQSIETLYKQSRIHQSFDLWEDANVKQLHTFITTTFTTPKWHMIRLHTRSSNYTYSIRLLKNHFPNATVIEWNHQTKRGDINTRLLQQPSDHSFIIIKNMFSASKTLHTEHIGVLYDRVCEKSKDSFILQSLVGRCCGYNRSSSLHVFTNLKSIIRYIRVWRDLDSVQYNESYPIQNQMPGLIYQNGQLQTSDTRITIGQLFISKNI